LVSFVFGRVPSISTCRSTWRESALNAGWTSDRYLSASGAVYKKVTNASGRRFALSVETNVGSVRSADGTSIAYDRQGSGPAVILVGGGLVDPATGRAGRSENTPLASELAEHFTVYNYDRRGRGDSGDTLPYTVEREIEDIDALIAETGSAHLYGVSSGGALALEVAATGIAIDKLAVYEVPYSMADDASQHWREYVEKLEVMLSEGRRGDAVARSRWAFGLIACLD
jgi:pimeloyl-ACP methyl ester carboxylesterase